MKRSADVSEIFIGVMSGTSLDGIDCVAIDFSKGHPAILGQHSSAFPDQLKATLAALCQPGGNEIERLGTADVELGRLIAKNCLRLTEKLHLSSQQICAIGSHGQTIRHRPDQENPFSLQIGNANIIADLTGITTITDFRMADIASGGQGAPLVPAFHQSVFAHDTKYRAIINFGGISNISLLSPQSLEPKQTRGYDIGPANTLMDQWIQQHHNKPYDQNGDWARSGKLIPELLETLLSHEFFKREGPKSTGRELFNLNWLNPFIKKAYPSEDIQRTLLELTAVSVKNCVEKELARLAFDKTLYICGGGTFNGFLLTRLTKLLPSFIIEKTDAIGLPCQQVEASAFAWLAKETMAGQPGNQPLVTGATRPKVLGAIYSA